MARRKSKLQMQDSVALLASLSFLVACAGQKSDCGNNVSAILNGELRGADSGLLGGFVKLADGKQCSAAFDVTDDFGGPNTRSFSVTMWTGHHCEIDVKELTGSSGGLNLPGVTIRIFKGNSYWDLKATHRISEVVDSHYRALSSAAPGLAKSLASDALVPPDQLRLASQSVCRENKLDNFCATYSDARVTEVLIGAAWGSSLPEEVVKVLEESKKARDKSRGVINRASGLDGETGRFSKSLEDYWRVWHHFSVAPLVDLWGACQPEADLQAFAQGSSGSGWESKLLGAGSRASNAELQTACAELAKNDAIFELAPVFGESVLDVMKEARLLDGEKPAAGQEARAFSKFLIEKEKSLRASLQTQWSSLFRSVFAPVQRGDVFVHSNVVQFGSSGAKRHDSGNKERQWQHAVVPLLAYLGSGQITHLATGIQVKGSEKKPDTFKALFEKGDSGSVFTYKGNFPFLVVSTVNGDESSGGASVVNVPENSVSGAGPDPFASEEDGSSGNGSPSVLKGYETAPSPAQGDIQDSAWTGTSVNPTNVDAKGSPSSASNCL